MTGASPSPAGVRENPQAFPHGNPTHGGDIGMSLRDWFAGQALGGLLSQGSDDSAVEYSFWIADQMLLARTPPTPLANGEPDNGRQL